MIKKIMWISLGVALFLLGQEILYAQAKKDLMPYLKPNSIDLQVENPNWEKIVGDDFYQNAIFLLGERHGIAYSYDVLWQYVKHLKTKTNFKYYLLETPLYWEIYLNLYFETGDEKYLKMPFQEAKGTFYANQNFYDFYKKLYQLNASLPAKDQIRFVSIDVEHQYKYSHALLLNSLRKYQGKAIEGRNFLDYFFEKDPEKTGEYEETYRQYQAKWQVDAAKLKVTLGKDFEQADYLIRNINYKFLAKNDPKDLARDSLMYLNFQRRTQTLNLIQDKAFGFMGIDHCYTAATSKFKYFAAYLPKNQYKTVSTIMLYSQSKTLMPNHYLPKIARFMGGKNGYFTTKMRSNDRMFERQRKMGVLKDATTSNMTLFNINQPNSPFYTPLSILHNFLINNKQNFKKLK